MEPDVTSKHNAIFISPNTNVRYIYARTFFGHSLICLRLRLCGNSSRRTANNRYRSVRRTRLTTFLIFDFGLSRGGFAQLTASAHIIWIRSLTFVAYIAWTNRVYGLRKIITNSIARALYPFVLNSRSVRINAVSRINRAIRRSLLIFFIHFRT